MALTVLAILAVAGIRSGAQQAQPSQLANFDIRIDPGGAAYRQRVAPPGAVAATGLADLRASGLARLRNDFAGVGVIDSPTLGTPEVVSITPGAGFLSLGGTDRVATMRAFLTDYSDAYGLTAVDLGSLEPVADYENPAGNMAWVEFEQRINGLPVFQGLVRGGFTAGGQLTRTTGPLATGLAPAALAGTPTLTAADAVAGAASNVGWTVAANSLVQTNVDSRGRISLSRGAMAATPVAWLVYFPVAPGVARLAWATEIWGDPDAFLVLLDAEDGTVLFRKNLTNYQTQSATYVIYNDDSPAPLSPSNILPGSGTQAPYISRTTVTVIGNEAPNTFNNLGWMTDATNSTDGNNVQAGVDRTSPNGVDAAVTGVSRVFNFSYDPQTDSPLTTAYQNGEVTDTFYWVNRYHDTLYLLGFTEAARNFQNNNFGRGGVAGDRISAEAQDSSGTNNANFSTPADGGRGRMQMYIFPGPTPDRSSGLDHDVLLHELTHGTSNRLHNDGSGLNTTMAGGMGEGWSDFYARALLSTADEDPNGVYAMGGWVTNLLSTGYTSNYYYGIRRFPYASISNHGTNGKPFNPLTFADIDSAQIDTTDGAYARNSVIGNTAFEVHNVGEVWASALLEVRARFITRLGFATGNQRVLQFVTDGMKLDPTNPTFLQGRDSIIAAANAGGGTLADVADIWAGFAARGMGYSAQVVNAGNGTVVEAFDVPSIGPSPSVVTTAATNVATTGATLNGTVNPNGTSATALLQYGLTTGYGSQVTVTPAPGAGSSAVAVSASVLGLTCNTTYHYRLVATNGGGTTNGLDQMFTTASCTPPELIQNGDFGSGTTTWQQYATPDSSYIVSNVTGGVLQFSRVPPPPGTSNQATVFQETGVPFGAFEPVIAQFDLGNSSNVRKRISVLTLDSDFSDLSVCTFWLPANTPLTTYQMKTHTTRAWANAAIYFYAATANAVGDAGFYRIDNVSMKYATGQATDRTVCVDPWAPMAPGGGAGSTLLTNGDFSGGQSPWGLFGTITSQITSGVFEFIRPTNTPPAGVILQATSQAMTTGQILTATFQLGNSSGVRKRVTPIMHDNDFSDLSACTFYLAPGQALQTYTMRMYATQAWSNATISFYAATIGSESWIKLDNVTLQRTPGTAIAGTECVEPAGAPLTAAVSLAGRFRGRAPATNSSVFGGGGRGAGSAGVRRSGGWTTDGFSPLPGRGRGGALGWEAVATSNETQILRPDEAVDLTTATAARLSFRSWLPSPRSTGAVQVSTDDGITWVTAAEAPTSRAWVPVNVDLSAYVGSVIDVRFAFEHPDATDTGSRDAWRVDGVRILIDR